MKIEPIFADTNLFLRYLTNDNPAQAEAIEDLLRQAVNGKISLVTNSMVIAELIWTLESFYHLSPSDIQNKIITILNTPGLEVSDEDLILQAVFWYVEKNVDFIDAYNAAWMQENGVKSIYTYDHKHFNRFEGFEVKTPSLST